MRISAKVEGLSMAQWTEVQEIVKAEYEFAPGMTRVCAVFIAEPAPWGLEAHVEMPLMAYTKVVARLAHLAHAAPAKVISAVWDRSEPREARPDLPLKRDVNG